MQANLNIVDYDYNWAHSLAIFNIRLESAQYFFQ